MEYAVNLPMIIYFFLGHSGMSGYCAAMDTVPHERVWTWTANRGFFHCTDNDFPNHFQVKSGSPCMPFLKAMALRYPQYNFCGIKYGHACGQAFHVYTEEGHRNFFISHFDSLKSKGVFGGAIIYYGYIEGKNKNDIINIDESIDKLCSFLRGLSGNSSLPILFIRYEINSDTSGAAHSYRQWDSLMVQNIERLPICVHNLSLIPFRYLTKEMFCDNHHPNADGYEIIGEDGAATIQTFNYDWWKN